jgi:hypothetical protein
MHITTWPQPVRDQLQVQVELPADGDKAMEFRGIDILGRECFSHSVRASMGQAGFTQDVSQLPPGVYNLVVTDGTLIQNMSIVVAR